MYHHDHPINGGPAKATELILAKDHTNVVNQAAWNCRL